MFLIFLILILACRCDRTSTWQPYRSNVFQRGWKSHCYCIWKGKLTDKVQSFSGHCSYYVHLNFLNSHCKCSKQTMLGSVIFIEVLCPDSSLLLTYNLRVNLWKTLGHVLRIMGLSCFRSSASGFVCLFIKPLLFHSYRAILCYRFTGNRNTSILHTRRSQAQWISARC